MKVVTILGARPQFIKAAQFSNEFRKNNVEIIVHTGQHYDYNMSEIFFNELNIPKPNYSLGIGSGTHASQTAKMMESIEKILFDEKPDAVIVYGDTNSTLAGALAACKIHVPVIHIEAGLRSFNKKMPEEVNRIITDHVSSVLFCPTNTALENLKNENITSNCYLVGDIMKDAVLKNLVLVKSKLSLDCWIDKNELNNPNLEKIKKGYYLVTVHRAENTDDISKLKVIIQSLSYLDKPALLALHPRTKKVIMENEIVTSNCIIIDPVGYLEMLLLIENSKGVITDSGGLQKETYILSKPCVTLRNETEWIETLSNGCNKLSNILISDILENVRLMSNIDIRDFDSSLYGTGNTSLEIVKIIERIFNK